MDKPLEIKPEHTAVRVALWRALHTELDSAPLIFKDTIGEKLVGDPQWRNRPDMDPNKSRRVRTSIVARAQFVEEIVERKIKEGVKQYVILGAGLDSFAQRRLDLANQVEIFEIDQLGPQLWKKQRLQELGFNHPKNLHFVPVNFEQNQSWWEELLKAGFDPKQPAVVVSTGVSMYLSKEANFQTLRTMTQLSPESCFAMTLMLRIELLEPEDQAILEFTMKMAAKSGTPFVSLFTPEEILSLAKEAGHRKAKYISPLDLREKFCKGRSDGLTLPSAEAFLITEN